MIMKVKAFVLIAAFVAFICSAAVPIPAIWVPVSLIAPAAALFAGKILEVN